MSEEPTIELTLLFCPEKSAAYPFGYFKTDDQVNEPLTVDRIKHLSNVHPSFVHPLPPGEIDIAPGFYDRILRYVRYVKNRRLENLTLPYRRSTVFYFKLKGPPVTGDAIIRRFKNGSDKVEHEYSYSYTDASSIIYHERADHILPEGKNRWEITIPGYETRTLVMNPQ